MGGLEGWLIRFGPAGVLIGSALEGDVTPLLAGVVAHLGYLHPAVAVLTSAVGLVVGDTAWFLVGRRIRARLRSTRAWQRVGAVVERLVGRFGAGEIVLARVVYGTRNMSMVFWGANGLPLMRFWLIDAPACLAWAAVLVAAGHAASGGVAAVLGEVKRAEQWVAVAVVLALAAVGVWRWGSRRWARP